jgi:hypothetical protein
VEAQDRAAKRQDGECVARMGRLLRELWYRGGSWEVIWDNGVSREALMVVEMLVLVVMVRRERGQVWDRYHLLPLPG